jgi:all-trans-retinol 13,14-reductase
MNTEHHFDTVIIGGGLGGLVCANILSKEGLKVCVLEKNKQIGGCLQSFKRDGIMFDSAVHYVCGLDKGQTLYQLFQYLGIMDRLEIERMDSNGFDAVLFGNDDVAYCYGMGYENFITQMLHQFPDEENAIRTYCTDIKKICNNHSLFHINMENIYSNDSPFHQSARAYFDQLTENKKLRAVLAGTNLLYAGLSNKTPLFVHALVVNHYIESAWKCLQGSDQIVKLLAKNIKADGGMILRKQEVISINVEDSEAKFVDTKNGERFYAKQFISNIAPDKTLELTETDSFRPAFRNRIKSLENSAAAFMLHIVLKPDTIKYTNRNYYYFDDTEVWNCMNYTEQYWPYTYALFQSSPKDNSEFTQSIAVMSYMRFEEVAKWQNTCNTSLNEESRSEDYEVFKKAKADKLLQTVYKKFPEVKDAIQAVYTSTPLSYRDYIGTSDGNMYGVVKDFNDPLKTFISPKTKVPNLYLTGANINLHGVLGVTETAFITSFFILGKDYLMNKVQQANA